MCYEMNLRKKYTVLIFVNPDIIQLFLIQFFFNFNQPRDLAHLNYVIFSADKIFHIEQCNNDKHDSPCKFQM